MRHSSSILFTFAACLGIGFSFGIAVENENSAIGAKVTSDKGSGTKPFLGLNITNLRSVLTSDAAGTNGERPGILVEEVHSDSPSAKAGIREMDVLLMYDDQRLFNCDQLRKLIESDCAGRDVLFRLSRNSKQEVVAVRLGERPSNLAIPAIQLDSFPKDLPKLESSEWIPKSIQKPDFHEIPPSSWERIDSLTIKRLEHDRFQVSVTLATAEEQSLQRSYEGTCDEIRRRISADVQLNADDRLQLLKSIGL